MILCFCISLSVCLSVCLYVCLYVCMYVRSSSFLSMWLSVHLCICISVILCVCIFVTLYHRMCVCLCVILSVCLCACIRICLSLCPCIFASVCPFVYVSVCLCLLCLSMFLYLWLSVSDFLSVCMSVCLCVCLYLSVCVIGLLWDLFSPLFPRQLYLQHKHFLFFLYFRSSPILEDFLIRDYMGVLWACTELCTVRIWAYAFVNQSLCILLSWHAMIILMLNRTISFHALHFAVTVIPHLMGHIYLCHNFVVSLCNYLIIN